MAPITKILIGILISCFVFASLFSSLQESPISDEPGHIAAGIMYLKQGDLTFNSGSPLLSNTLSAVPLSFVISNSDIPSDPVFKQKAYLHSFALAFLAKNVTRIDLILFLSRLPSLIFGIGIALLIFFWAKKMYGEAPALFSLSLFCLEPSFLAHSHYATPDVSLAFFFLLTLYSLYLYLSTNNKIYFVLLLISFSAAQLVKNSAIYLLPIIWFIFLFDGGFNFKKLKNSILIAGTLCLSAWFIINAFYGFRGLGGSLKDYLIHDPSFLNSPYSLSQIEKILPKSGLLGSISRYFFEKMPLPLSYDYLKTIGWVFFRSQNGQSAYLFGQVSQHGWWFYYPVILFFKTSPLFILTFFVALISLFYKKSSLGRKELLYLLIPSFGMLLLTMKSGIDTGVRQILFLLPLLMIFSGRIYLLFNSNKLKVTLFLLIISHGILTYSNFPNFLSYFNPLAGNQTNTSFIASDSNSDWGQDVKKLAVYINENHISNIKMNLFGVVNTDLYGVKYDQYGPSWIRENNLEENCSPLKNSYFAISLTQISGVYLKNTNCFSWLSSYTPAAKIGGSIYLYDL